MSYTINKEYALASAEGSSTKTSSDFIILHDVGAETGAEANARYFKQNWNTAETYVAFVVGDGGKVFQVGTPGYVQWGAGTVANAKSPVQIELGHTTSASQFKQDYAVYIELARDMGKKYGIPLTLDAGGSTTKGVKTHRWVTDHIWGDHVDPYGYLARFGITKAKLTEDIKNGVSNSDNGNSTTSLLSTVTINNQKYYNGPIKQLKTLKQLNGFKDKQLNVAVNTAPIGVYTVSKIVYDGKIPRALLKSGVYMTLNSAFVKPIK